MKHLSVLIFCFMLGLCVDAQRPPLMANDTAYVYYSKTNFFFEDSMDLWSFYVQKDMSYNIEDSIPPVYELTFKRSLPINNFYTGYPNRDWQTTITYKVYRLKDSTYCYDKSRRVRGYTNFIPPYAGGDYFILGKFIFLNTDMCLRCIQYRTGEDYCRPLINTLISKLDPSKPYSIEGIVRQFPIKREDPPENLMPKHKKKNPASIHL